MADNKIPVLTEVYQPQKEAKSARKENASLELTPDLMAKLLAEIRPVLADEMKAQVNAHVKAQMEAEIVQARENVFAELNSRMQDNMANARESVFAELNSRMQDNMTQASNFLDKAKADLKTDLPLMYQKSAELLQADLKAQLDQLEKEARAKFEADLVESSQAVTNSTIVKFNSQLESIQTSKSADASKQLQKELAAFQKEATKTNENIVKAHADLSQSLNEFFQKTGKKMEAEFSKNFQAYQTQLLAEHQNKLDEGTATLTQTLLKRIEENMQEQLSVIDTQAGAMQQEVVAQLRERFSTEKTEIYQAAAAEIKTTFAEQMTAKGNEIKQTLLAQISGELPVVQEVLRKNVQQLVTQSMANLETRMRAELNAELKSLLLSVKFVLPEKED